MKIHIFGASGSGVTTLGKTLAEKLKLPYFDSDTYFWEISIPPFTKRKDPEHRNLLIKTELEKSNKWILGGSVINWGDKIFPDFDLIIFLWVPPEIRIERLKKRELERYGSVILNDPKRNELFKTFINWAKDYDTDSGIANRTFNAHQNWLNKQHGPYLEIKGNQSNEERIEIILNQLKKGQ